VVQLEIKKHPVEDKIAFIRSQPHANGYLHSAVRLQAILFRLKEGQTLPEIKRDLPEVPISKLLHARSYFAATYPELYRPHFSEGFKVLVDENLDPHYVTDATRRAFGEAVHISFVPTNYIKRSSYAYGTKDVMDIELWKYACANQFNLIVTKDKAEVEGRKHIDLTRCVTMRWKWRLQVNGGRVDSQLRQLPKILHFREADISGREAASRLFTNRDSIIEIFEESVSPIIELHKYTAKPGRNFMEILKGKIDPKLQRRITEETDRLMPEMDVDLLETSARKRIRKTVRNEVMLEIEGDFSKSVCERRRRLLNDYIAQVIAEEIEKKRPPQSSYSDFCQRTEMTALKVA
jgi:hypothetical protein